MPRTTKNSSGEATASTMKPPFFTLPADRILETVDLVTNRRSVTITVRGAPKPKGYHRFNRKSMHTYAKDGKLQREFKKALKTMLLGRPLPVFGDGPLKVVHKAYIPRPKSHFRGSMIGNELRPSALPIWKARVDVDNLGKFVLDGMNGIVFSDDHLITSLTTEKEYDDEHIGKCVIIISTNL